MTKRRTPRKASRPGSSAPPEEGGVRREGISLRRRWAIGVLWFTVFFFFQFGPLYSGKLEPRWDARDEFYPAFTYFADSLNEGRFPLWDPYTSCGYPFHAEPHQPTLNPVATIIAYIVTDTGLGFLLYWTIHWWWGGIGMMWLTGSNGAAPSGGLVAALAYVFSGFFVGNAQHTPFITVAGWLPWTIGLADLAVRRSSLAYALFAGVALGQSAMGGYPMLVSFTGLAAALWLFFRFLPKAGAANDDPRSLARRACWIGGTLLVMAIVLFVVWSPVLNAFFREGRGYTDRVAPLAPGLANFEEAFSLPALYSLFHPLMTIVGKGKWMQADLSMTNAYLGILTVPLAFYWFLKGGENRRPLWLAAFFLFMFLLSFGGKAGLRTVLYYLFPPLKYGRHSSTFRLYWIFALCFAAGLGFARLMVRPAERKFAFGLLLSWTGITLAASLFMGIFLASHGKPPGDHFPRLYYPAMLVLPLGVLVFLIWERGGKTISGLAPALLVLAFHGDMAGHLYNNMETVGVPRDSIRQAERFHRRKTFIPGEPGPRHPPRRWNYFNVQQVIKEPVVQGYIAMQSKGFDAVLVGSRFVEVMRSPVRYWITPGAETLPSRDSALSILSGVGAGTPVPVFLEQVPPGISCVRTVPGAFGSVRIQAYSPEKIEMEVDVPGAKDAFLVSTERFASGWKAWVDGNLQNVMKINLYFRGIPVPPGSHTVLWKYEPEFWGLLVAVSHVATLLSLGAGFFLLRKGADRAP